MKPLLALLLIPGIVLAWPTKSMERTEVTLNAICTPTLTSLLTALTEDFAVHVSLTYEETGEIYLMIIENPNTESAGIIRITEEKTCLISSGVELQHFERPEGMAPPKIDIYNQEESA